MAHKRKDTLAPSPEWWKHLRAYNKRVMAKRERRAAEKFIEDELDASLGTDVPSAPVRKKQKGAVEVEYKYIGDIQFSYGETEWCSWRTYGTRRAAENACDQLNKVHRGSFKYRIHEDGV